MFEDELKEFKGEIEGEIRHRGVELKCFEIKIKHFEGDIKYFEGDIKHYEGEMKW